MSRAYLLPLKWKVVTATCLMSIHPFYPPVMINLTIFPGLTMKSLNHFHCYQFTEASEKLFFQGVAQPSVLIPPRRDEPCMYD
jgi:hypothetical protein